ncbi:MAG: hypothetical protein JSS81_06360 [Acidobacteria bacterium]|nr:hypothetical protein [Acidobacteriota bacterium]
MNLKKVLFLSFILTICLFSGGCGLLGNLYNNIVSVAGLTGTGTVIAKKANIRTSYAVVASDLLEVKRGDQLDVLDQVDFEKAIWYRVRAHDEDQTEGWIEAQNIITGDVLEKSKKLAEEDKDAQPQANGLLRNKTNLRLTPEQRDDNVLVKLDNGSTFEIITWKYVPKAQDDTDDNDKDPKNAKTKSKDKDKDIEAAKTEDEPDKMDDKYDIWYKVRIDPSVSPAPSGWIFGRQVELQVPTDIVFYQQNNKKFVTWQRIDGVDTSIKDDPKAASKPSSWVILSRTNESKPFNGEEPDFDGVLLLGYDKYDQSHYRIYPLIGEVWGKLPMKMQGTGDSRTFTLRLRNKNTGAIEDKNFVVSFDKVRYKLKLPDDMANYETKEGK